MVQRLALVALVALAAACGAEAEKPEAERSAGADAAPTSEAIERAVAATVLAASAGVQRAPVQPEAPVEALAAGFDEAGFGLLRTQPATANVVLSPASIGHALLMARAAADDATGRAIDTALALPAVGAHDAWNALDAQLAAADAAHDDVEITFADRIWPRAGLQPDQAWVDLLASRHGADTETLDFAGDAEGSRSAINGWVAGRTHGRIPELVPAGSISPETLLVLTDAVYFRARWQQVFGKYGTAPGAFTRADGSTVEVDFMVERELADRRGRGDGFAGAEIPYVGAAFSMLVIVPDEGRFEEIRDRLGTDFLAEVDATFTTGPYELRLPKWEDTSTIDLGPWLEGLGIAPGSYPAIDPAAFLAAGIHAADIAVDEEGTVAAAATALYVAASGVGDPQLTIAADRPFLYLIRHRASGLVLFAGQVADPTA